MVERGIPWHIRIKRYLTEPRRPSEILKYFKNLKKPVMYRNLKNLIKWGEVQKIEEGRNVFYVVSSYEKITNIVKEEMIRLKRKKEKERPLGSKEISYHDILRSNELLEEVAIRLGCDPEDEAFRKKFFNSLSFLKRELEEAEESIWGKGKFEGIDKTKISKEDLKLNPFDFELKVKNKKRDLNQRKNGPGETLISGSNLGNQTDILGNHTLELNRED